MQVFVENTSGAERRVTVQVPGNEIEEKINAKLREIGKTVRIKGFRPGRVPATVVKQRFGQQARQEVVNEVVQQNLQQAIQDENIRPASRPRLEEEPKNNDVGNLEFSALIDVYPDIDTLDVSAMEIERPDTEVTQDDVDEMLATLRTQRISWEKVERNAKEGDQVLIEYAAETKEGRVPAEGTQRLAIIMGESGFDELEKAIAGIAPDEEKNVKLTFPEDFREAELAGKKAKVDVQVVSVSEGNTPEVDEEFIKSFGVEEGTQEAFETEIRGNLERELKQATNTFLKTQLIDQLVKATPDLEVPEGVVRQEAASMAAQMIQSQGQQVDPELVQKLVEPFMEQAGQRVRAGLLMGELAHQNSIRIDSNKVREAIELAASTYEDPAEVVQLYYSNQQLMQQVESSVLEEQVVDWVMENAKVAPKEMKFQEVITAASNRT
jgi:trigger factor